VPGQQTVAPKLPIDTLADLLFLDDNWRNPRWGILARLNWRDPWLIG